MPRHPDTVYNTAFTVVALGAAVALAAAGDWLGAVAIAAIVGTIDYGIWAFTRAGARARALMAEETRLQRRTRPVGVTVDFAGVLEPVPCEVVPDPDGEVDEQGDPLAWLARPLYIPEGADRITTYAVATWPSRHSITLTIEGLDP